MSAFKALTLAAVTWLSAGSIAFADVQLTIQKGRVSLVAKDATVRQILTEWARVGQTRIVNIERISGGPVTLELNNVSEQEALDVLLRSVSGYVAAPRAVGVANASVFDRIIVMATSAAAAVATASPSPPGSEELAVSGQFGQLLQTPADDDSEDEQPAAADTRGVMPPAQPQPQGGSAVPGMIVQPPPRPGQAQPGAPPQPQPPDDQL